ncbi:hypothetical protein [Paraburkholderia youngii]|uniref:hypothetical protein n=1 Tax=Paraburkholderia youngii TaxID=2782701 RepID=UPI003D1D7841
MATVRHSPQGRKIVPIGTDGVVCTASHARNTGKTHFIPVITKISFSVERICFETFFADLINPIKRLDVLPESGKGREPDGANLAQQAARAIGWGQKNMSSQSKNILIYWKEISKELERNI